MMNTKLEFWARKGYGEERHCICGECFKTNPQRKFQKLKRLQKLQNFERRKSFKKIMKTKLQLCYIGR